MCILHQSTPLDLVKSSMIAPHNNIVSGLGFIMLCQHIPIILLVVVSRTITGLGRYDIPIREIKKKLNRLLYTIKE